MKTNWEDSEVRKLINNNKQLQQQRDELREKLEYALDFPRALLTNEGFKAEVRAAIAAADEKDLAHDSSALPTSFNDWIKDTKAKEII